MSEPIKPFAWLVIDKEDGCEYGNMHPDYGRDCCHEHIKDAQETGIPHARRWVVREVFSREQVEQATAELHAECDALRAEVIDLKNAGEQALQFALQRIPHECEGLDYAAAYCPACQLLELAALKEAK